MSTLNFFRINMSFKTLLITIIFITGLCNLNAQKIVENGINSKLVGSWVGAGEFWFGNAKYTLNFSSENKLKILVDRDSSVDLKYETTYFVLSNNLIKVDFFWPANGPDTLLYWMAFNEKYIEVGFSTSLYSQISGKKNVLKNSSFYRLKTGNWHDQKYAHLKETFRNTSIVRSYQVNNSLEVPKNWIDSKSYKVGYSSNTIWIHNYRCGRDKIIGYLFENDRLYLSNDYITLRRVN